LKLIARSFGKSAIFPAPVSDYAARRVTRTLHRKVAGVCHLQSRGLIRKTDINSHGANPSNSL
jgi:hypothetical protein